MRLLVIAGLVMAPLAGVQAAGDVEFGFSKAEGNTDTEKMVAGITSVNQLATNVRNNLALTAVSGKADGKTNEESYGLTNKTDYLLSDKSYLFGRLNMKHENFTSYDEEASIGVGYGRQLIKNATTDLKMEAGPAYRVLNRFDEPGSSDAVVAYLGETLGYKLSDNASLIQSLAVESGSDNTQTELAVALKSALTKALALKVYAKGTYNSDVGATSKHLDTETGVSVAYNFD